MNSTDSAESDAALRELIAKYQAIDSYLIAQVYAFRNQSNEAFEWLDRSYAQRDSGLIGTKVEPLLKSLHKDPRYAALLKKLNLAMTDLALVLDQFVGRRRGRSTSRRAPKAIFVDFQ